MPQLEKSLRGKEDPAQPKIINNKKPRRQKTDYINYSKGDILKSEKNKNNIILRRFNKNKVSQKS